MIDIKKIVKRLYSILIIGIIILLIVFSLLNLFIIPFYNSHIENKYKSKFDKKEILKIQSFIKYILVTFSFFILFITLIIYLMLL